MQPEAGHITPSPTPRARSRPRGGAWRARLPRPWCCRRLRAQCELLQRGVLARLVDATLELVLRFELAALGRDQTEDGHLAPGQKTQRFEAAGARAVIFEKVAIHLDFVEDELGDRLVAAVRHPRAGEIAAAKMHTHCHVPRPILDRGIEELGVG